MANTRIQTGYAAAAPADKQAGLVAGEQEWFELQPVEKKLIRYSFGLGVVLLAIFVFAFGVAG